jgi:RNA polymerase sigma factor (sigma-70 family)
LQHPEAFLVWLRRIVRNAVVNWVRKQQYRRDLADRRAEEERVSGVDSDDPASEAARKECLDQIEEALRSLFPKLREAMLVYYIEGNTAREAAESLWINVDTMKK